MNPAYRTAVFHAEEKLPTTAFSIVTAWNPNGTHATAAENQNADRELEATIRALGESPIRITGMNKEDTHRELGWTILDNEAAIGLGKQFRQEAIYRVSQNRLLLIHLPSGAEEDLGDWRNFLIQ